MTRKVISFALFAALSLGLTFAIGAQIANVQLGTSRYGLSATFDDVTNLRAGNPVRLAGVPVGQVSSVKVVDGRALVKLEVDRDVHLPTDSEVAVRWLNIIGQRELYLYPGKATDELRDGATLTRTRSVVDLGALLNELGPLTRSLDPAEINRLVAALVTAFDGNRGAVNQIISDLGVVLHTLAARKDTIGQLVVDYATISAAVAKRNGEIGRVIDNLSAITTTFADSGPVLDDALANLPRLVENLKAVLGADAAKLGPTIDDLSQVTATVHAHLGDLATTLHDLPAGLAAVGKATSYGQFVLINAICLASTPPPCPTPVILVANSTGAGAVATPSSFQRLLLGAPS